VGTTIMVSAGGQVNLNLTPFTAIAIDLSTQL
jgi:hypothetical protein